MYEMIVWLSQNDSENDRIPLSLDLSFLPDCELVGFQQDITKLKYCLASFSIWGPVYLLAYFHFEIGKFWYLDDNHGTESIPEAWVPILVPRMRSQNIIYVDLI